MPKTIQLPVETKKPIYRLPTQAKRAAFVRKEMRKRGLTVTALAELSELCINTIMKYTDLVTGNSKYLYATKDPRTDTTRKIFRALGYDLCFTSRESKGIIEL